MNLNEMMKPYFEKQEEIQNKYVVQKNYLTLRLERLRDKKEKEISEYLENSLSTDRNFYAGYGSMVRADLEREYAKKEEEIENELKSVNKYYRVDVRELVSIKEELRKQLFVRKRELELKIRETQISADLVMLNLAKFKAEYDENYNVVNGEDRKKLFDRSNELVEVKYNLQRELKEVENYLNLTQLTQEEASIIMMSMTPWEKEEYDRRKAVKEDYKEEKLPLIVEDEQIEEKLPPIVKEEPVEEKLPPIVKEDPIEEKLPPIVEDEYVDDNSLVADSFADLIKDVYSDVLTSAKKLRAVRIDGDTEKILLEKDVTDEEYRYAADLEEVELPNGTYLNKKDISKALDNYRKESKGRTFKVAGFDKEFEVTKKTIKKVKKALNDCSIVRLLREKKLGFFDIKRVYGKTKAEEYSSEADMGRAKTTVPTGDYINVKDFAYALKDMFAEKSQSWLDRFRQRLRKKSTELDYYEIDDEEFVKTK